MAAGMFWFPLSIEVIKIGTRVTARMNNVSPTMKQPTRQPARFEVPVGANDREAGQYRLLIRAHLTALLFFDHCRLNDGSTL